MTLPERLPLEPPPGDPAALDDLVQRVAGAVFCLGVLETSLEGPAGAAPGWIGDDAEAATARIASVAALAREGSGALWRAAGRLGAHRDVLADARNRIRALVARQDEEYAAAWGRLAALPELAAAVRAGDPAAVAVADDVAAAEAVRGREHAALLAEVAADARATGLVLAQCSGVVGGTGRPGDAGRAVAHLALALPEWGEAELSLRGGQLARGLLGEATPEERDALAAGARAYAGDGAFARALVEELGAEGVELLLLALGSGQYDQDSAIAAVLAAALGAAVPTGAHDPVRAVLDATYVRARDRYGRSDVVAAGMAAVLAAGATTRRGLQPETVARWAGQLLRREHEHGVPAGAGAVPHAWDAASSDPAALAVTVLVECGEPGPVASLLTEADVWQTLLARFWADGGAALSGAVGLLAEEPGAAGDDAVRAGLTAIGAGLFEGAPSGWTVSRRNVAAVAPAMAGAVAAHVDVAVDALWVGVDDARCLGASDALRGLGHLTVDRGAAVVVGDALDEWARGVIAGADAQAQEAAIAVSGAYLATQEYGQRLSHALDTYEAQEAAQLREVGWNWTVGLVPHVLPKGWGTVAELLTGYAAIGLRADGTWEDIVDSGPVLDAGTAGEQGLELGGPTRGLVDVVRQARSAFERTAGALGDPAPVRSPQSDPWAPVADAVPPDGGGRRRPSGPGVTPRTPG